MKLGWVVVLVIACKGKAAAPASGSGNASARTGDAAIAVVDDAAEAAPSAKLEIDTANDAIELQLAFDNQVPRLPAVSRDGTLVAELAYDFVGMPPPVAPVSIAIRRLDGTGTPERLELVDDKLSADAGDSSWGDKPPPAAVVKLLHDRAAAIRSRLTGFASLVPVDLATDSGGFPQPTRIGDLTLTPREHDDKLGIELTTADGRVVHHAQVAGYETQEKPESFAGGACAYTPDLHQAYLDQAKGTLFVAVGFRFNEECTPQPLRYFVWPLPTAEDAELAGLVAKQFETDADFAQVFAADAVLVNGSELATDAIPYTFKAGDETYTGHADSNLEVTRAHDGRSAWASVTTKLSLLPRNQPGRDDPWRASSVLVKTAAGWRIAATTWSVPVANATVNKDAKAGKLRPAPAFTADPGDPALRTAFAKLVTDGLDAEAAARGDLVALGSAPGERTTTGAVLAKGWRAGWQGKTTVTSSIARLTPSGTTGWVVANVELAKPGYQIPFQVFAVFDKASGGAWTLVHLHFSV